MLAVDQADGIGCHPTRSRSLRAQCDTHQRSWSRYSREDRLTSLAWRYTSATSVRYGELALETDEGEQLVGRAPGKELFDRWDLDLDELGRVVDFSANRSRRQPRQVHKLLFSMAAGTPLQAVLVAARSFLREEFGLKHRYAFVLHTDEPHPHVHAVVKADSEQGMRRVRAPSSGAGSGGECHRTKRSGTKPIVEAGFYI